MPSAELYVQTDPNVFKPVSYDHPIPVDSAPRDPAWSTNLSGPIEEANVFQVVQAATPGRRGGTIQNQFSNSSPMWVFLGPLADAAKDKSLYLRPGDPPFSLSLGAHGTIPDEICVAGQKGEVFFALFQ